MSQAVYRVNALYQSSKFLYELAQDDITGGSLTACSFNLQQSINLYLKFLVEMTGKDYNKKNDVSLQMPKLKSYNDLNDLLDSIKSEFKTYLKWHENMIYNGNEYISEKSIETGFEIFQKLFEYCSKLCYVEGVKISNKNLF